MPDAFIASPKNHGNCLEPSAFKRDGKLLALPPTIRCMDKKKIKKMTLQQQQKISMCFVDVGIFFV